MRFARWVFLVAGASGVLLIAPLYFEGRFFESYPPPINRREFYYGFAGVTLAWQAMFLLIASDPIRYRPAMAVAVLEKAGFVFAVPVLYAQGDVEAMWLGAAAMDGTLMILFAVSFFVTPKGSPPPGG